MTFFGAFLRRLGGWIAVADLIALMADVGLDAQAVRSSVSRLKRRGVIESERRGGAAGYRLTPHGEAILRAGDARIFGRRDNAAARADDVAVGPRDVAARPRDIAAGSRDVAARPRDVAAGRRDIAARPREPAWLLVVFSIPEQQRAVRHRLRSGLAGLGLGTVAPAVWIAPAHLRDEVVRLVEELGIGDRVDLFAADPLGGDVGRWWDLDALAAEYAAYLADWEGVDGGGFAEHIRHLDAWRRIPFHDPGLPSPVSERAWTVFAALDARLAPAAWAEVQARTAAR
jgi:phenylacetic acid degradation operon negative regulatory protein